GAGRRPPARSLRRDLGRRLSGHGNIGRLGVADVEMGTRVRAGGPLLHGRVRRVVPEPLLARVRVHAGLPRCARVAAGSPRPQRTTRAQAGVAGLGPRGAPLVLPRRRDAGRPRRQYAATTPPAPPPPP